MKFRAPQRIFILPSTSHLNCVRNHTRRSFTSIFRRIQTSVQARASIGGGNGSSQGDSYLVPGATVATLLMLGALHARRLYDDKKVEEAREKGIEPEFRSDIKATFLRLIPLRLVSRCWGQLTSVELPIWLRPYVYRAWARAFHSNLEEAALPLDEYASLREFFVRSLKDGCRPIDPDLQCLVSPVDGTVLRFGELKGAGAMIEQVKGFSYSVASLLGASSLLPMMAAGDRHEEGSVQENSSADSTKKSWWKISLAYPKVLDRVSTCPVKGLFYCVIYLKPGDYHRIHSPVDWQVLVRRHFSGHLFPMNERAVRTIRNLYVENERVVLEGLWQEGFMAIAAIGATNIGSIEVYIEPELQTNNPKKKSLHSEPPEERVYEPEGVGIMLKKGDEMAAFNMGSTVVLIFQAPVSNLHKNGDSKSEFKFSIKRGDRVHAGEALGRWA
ncbi:phosphatidylserine decarboxylase proenzyme 1, mitochondrial isoform X2 [Momordica charantia]|uniref:Phosphatidylserine decarboxylase proenzyme 1, mitochondrial n=1 Tax=Momordica charantia TaxID=3673 RepID=A0A6J1DMQ0_MOMCH|nr:phosphatidylserine decarboxylase proenzyme 1, mitochondrial isoform X2 [Momordica charantia]